MTRNKNKITCFICLQSPRASQVLVLTMIQNVSLTRSLQRKQVGRSKADLGPEQTLNLPKRKTNKCPSLWWRTWENEEWLTEHQEARLRTRFTRTWGKDRRTIQTRSWSSRRCKDVSFASTWFSLDVVFCGCLSRSLFFHGRRIRNWRNRTKFSWLLSSTHFGSETWPRVKRNMLWYLRIWGRAVPKTLSFKRASVLQFITFMQEEFVQFWGRLCAFSWKPSSFSELFTKCLEQWTSCLLATSLFASLNTVSLSTWYQPFFGVSSLKPFSTSSILMDWPLLGASDSPCLIRYY